jgi:hypothetical protein
MLGVRGMKQGILAMLPSCGVSWSKSCGQFSPRLSSLAWRAPHPGSCSIFVLYRGISGAVHIFGLRCTGFRRLRVMLERAEKEGLGCRGFGISVLGGAI